MRAEGLFFPNELERALDPAVGILLNGEDMLPVVGYVSTDAFGEVEVVGHIGSLGVGLVASKLAKKHSLRQAGHVATSLLISSSLFRNFSLVTAFSFGTFSWLLCRR